MAVRWLHRNRRALGLSLLAATVVAAGIFHNALLNASANFLVDTDVPQRADLIYLLGGNYLVRAPAAAALFRQGWASKILLSREASPSTDGGGKRENFTDITERILIENGVPRDRIIQFSPAAGVRSTADEARALRLYLDAYPATRILVVTSALHSRRARMALTRAVPSNVQVSVVAANDPDCGLTNWRETQYCRNQVETEWTKLVFYFCTFFG
jgi:uncharacterized SAM-binding protein YcdF (DUF218 family)